MTSVGLPPLITHATAAASAIATSGMAGPGGGIGGSSRGEGGGGNAPPLERPEDLYRWLNVYPQAVIVFEPLSSTENGRVLLVSDKLQELLGFTVFEAAYLSLQEFLSDDAMSRLKEGQRQLAAGRSVFVEQTRLRTKRHASLSARVTFSMAGWHGKPIGLCWIEDEKTLREKTAAFDRPHPGAGAMVQALVYNSLHRLRSDIENEESELCRQLRLPLEELPKVEVRAQGHAANLLKNPVHSQPLLDLLNIHSKTADIPEKKRFLISAGEGDTPLVDQIRKNGGFRPFE